MTGAKATDRWKEIVDMKKTSVLLLGLLMSVSADGGAPKGDKAKKEKEPRKKK